MRHFLALLLLFTLSRPALSQLSVEWYKTSLPFGSIMVTHDDAFFMYGQYPDPLDLSGDGATDLDTLGGSDAYLAHFDAAGNLIWARRAGGSTPSPIGLEAFGSPRLTTDTAQALAEDASGNLYLGGQFRGAIDFDEDATPELTSADSIAAFIAQYGPDGTFNWARSLPLRNGTLRQLLVDPTANALYAFGLCQGNDQEPDTSSVTPYLHQAFYGRLDLDGNLEWLHRTETDPLSPFPPIWMGKPAQDAHGQLIVPGRFVRQVDFDSEGPFQPVGDAQTNAAFILTIQADGAISSLQTASGVLSPGWGRVYAMDDGIIVQGGKRHGELTFTGQDSTFTLASSGRTESVMARYDNEDQLVWTWTSSSTLTPTRPPPFNFSLSFTSGHDGAVDHKQRIWLAGQSSGSVSFDRDSIPELVSRQGTAFLNAFSTEGESILFHSPAVPADTTSSSYWNQVAPTSNGLLVSGLFRGMIDLDGAGPTPMLAEELATILVKYRFDEASVLHRPEEQALPPADFSISPPFPNPAQSSSQIIVQTSTPQHITVSLIDVLGREVKHLFDGNLAANTPKTLTIDLNKLPAGTYFIRAAGNLKVVTRPVVRR